MNLRESGEMYLENIYVLINKIGSVRAIDLGEYMRYSKPSVSRALSLLKQGNYITVSKEGFIALTEEGEKIAKNIFDRHTILNEFLISIGVSEKQAADDACKIEHDLSEETFNALKNYLIATKK